MADEVPEVTEAAPTPTVKRYKLKQKTESIELEDANGVIHKFTIRELDGPGREAYMTFMSNTVDLSKKGAARGVKSLKGMHAYLISRCLFDAQNVPVTEIVMKGWPGSVIASLYEDCKRVSGIDQDDEDSEKKE
jgi:hypothetical protein